MVLDGGQAVTPNAGLALLLTWLGSPEGSPQLALAPRTVDEDAPLGLRAGGDV